MRLWRLTLLIAIADGKKAAARHRLVLRAEIKAGNKVPFKSVVAVLNEFREAEIKRVDFHGKSIPGASMRTKRFRPYPLKNYTSADSPR